jgi:hypothetical protein
MQEKLTHRGTSTLHLPAIYDPGRASGKKKIVGDMVAVSDFRSMADLARVVSANLWRLPAAARLVVAVPESGRVPAALIALSTGRRMADLDRLLAEPAAPAGPVLLVDDAVATGATMRAARAALAARFPGLAVTRVAAFVRAGAEDAVDIGFAAAPEGALFEWSLFRAPVLAKTCLDMDGILCGDCPAAADDDGAAYRAFLLDTPPQVVPRGRLRRIVTARLEKYRAETEDWLARHGVLYDELAMLDLPSEAERRRLRPQARFKAEVYRADPATVLFVESESWQARAIARAVPGKAVFDYEAHALIDGAALAEAPAPRGAAPLARRLARAGRRLAARLPFARA